MKNSFYYCYYMNKGIPHKMAEIFRKMENYQVLRIFHECQNKERRKLFSILLELLFFRNTFKFIRTKSYKFHMKLEQNNELNTC
jgi:hypothetical protein